MAAADPSAGPPADPHAPALQALTRFVQDEQQIARERLHAQWRRPLAERVDGGWTQPFTHLERADDGGGVWARLADGESRFRVGDLLCLHHGNPFESAFGRQLLLAAEDDDRWLLTGHHAPLVLAQWNGEPFYADADLIDLTGLYRTALHELATSEIGRDIVLPLLARQVEPTFDDAVDARARIDAERAGFDARQCDAIAAALSADQVACIQGPPGTGKTRVLAHVVRELVARGERVLVTSHTHMAINNALARIGAAGVPVAKIGRRSQDTGLTPPVRVHDRIGDWKDRPRAFAVGATPFATVGPRLQGHVFDTVVFDEASQVTVPLALMAMRTARRWVFVGDPRQLPPVLHSVPVFDAPAHSAFGALTGAGVDHMVMLDRTWRMNEWLTAWPSAQYYGGRLHAVGANRRRTLQLAPPPAGVELDPLLAHPASGIFVPSPRGGRSVNPAEAERVASLVAAALAGGLRPEEIGIVTPFRAQGRALRTALARAVGPVRARAIVADTVERMQGQERVLVILSLASSEPAYLQGIASFFFQPQRLNVSLTRAIARLVVFGPDLDVLPDAGDEPRVLPWIAQYADLVRSLQRLDGPSR